MASQPETKKPSAASRYLFLFLIGLVVGAICTVMAMRALQARPGGRRTTLGEFGSMVIR